MPNNVLPEGSTWSSFKLTNVTDNHEVVVTFATDVNADGIPDKYQVVSVTANVEGDGSVDPSKNDLTLGGSASFTVTPGEGYALYQVKSGEVVLYTNTLASPFEGTFTIDNVLEDTVLTFVFTVDSNGNGVPDEEDPIVVTNHTITLSGDDNVSVTANSLTGAVQVEEGLSLTVTIAANTGYAVDTINIDGTDYVNNGQNSAPSQSGWFEYTFENVTENHTISVTSDTTTDETGIADKYKFTVNVTVAGEGGQASVEPVLVVYGGDATITITPDSGYAVDTIKVDETEYVNQPDEEEVTGSVTVGDQSYDTLSDAIDAIPDNTPTTMSLIADVEETIEIPASKEVTIDLAGMTLSATDGSAIVNNGTLILDDTTGEGEITASGTALYAVDNSGTLTINGGTYTGAEEVNGAAVMNESGASLTITAGTFNGSPRGVWNSGELTVEGGTFTGTGSYSESVGGSVFTGNMSAIANADDTGASLKISEGNFTTDGSYGSGAIYNGSGCSLEITGGTFTSDGSSGSIVANSGTATITGGEFDGDLTTRQTYIINSGQTSGTVASLTMGEDVVVKGTFGAVRAAGGSLQIDGGTYENTNDSGLAYTIYVAGEGEPAQATITSGTFTGTNTTVMSGYTGVTGASTVSIEGGSFTTTTEGKDCIGTAGVGTLAVTGGTYSTDPTQYLAEGYSVSEAEGVYTVLADVSE